MNICPIGLFYALFGKKVSGSPTPTIPGTVKGISQMKKFNVAAAKAAKGASVCLTTEKINLVVDSIGQGRVTVSGTTVDWIRAEVGDWLSRHPGEKRRAIRQLMCRPEYRRVAREFYGER